MVVTLDNIYHEKHTNLSIYKKLTGNKKTGALGAGVKFSNYIS